jgi:glycosyltransferase involved in cell wall biosynthesis/organic radical activating enzyme
MNSPLFSIIIPTFNSEKYINRAVESIFKQTFNNYECIIVDDCSTDNTMNIILELENNSDNLRVYQNCENCGPGIARNVGIEHARGEYIVFLDSDDELVSGLLEQLYQVMNCEKNFDICDYNYCKKYIGTETKGIRKDIEWLKKTPYLYKTEFLKLHTDAQVIQTCYRRSFLTEHNIVFSDGYHEDVGFFFKAFCLSQKRVLLEYVGYIKNDRVDSIVATCSEKHIKGFFEAWLDIKSLIELDEKLVCAWKEGLIGIGAIKIRDIHNSNLSIEQKISLYKMIAVYEQDNIMPNERLGKFQTKYYILVNTLINLLDDSYKVNNIETIIGEILNKSWSCWDIQHSMFLASDEIRACCKRFFYEGKQKGDVVITTISQNMQGAEVYQSFLNKRKDLYVNVNKGEQTECMGCPYLKFENWNDDFSIRKISFEYHSLCNLRCNYCSEKYYGGKTPNYDVIGFVNQLVQEQLLEECESIVWGGGEPTLDRSFITLLQMTIKHNDKAIHNVITNSTKYIPELGEILKCGRINLITSIDAGTEETYEKVRGKKLFNMVLDNLNKYSKYNESKIIIKYIVKKENCDISELNSFVSKIVEYKLQGCNFQISCDFKNETLDFEEKLGVVVLYGLLLQQNVEVIYFDELLRERLKIDVNDFEKINKCLCEIGLSHILLEEKIDNIVIWGSENQIKSLMENTLYFKKIEPIGLIAGHSSYYGKDYKGLHYSNPEDFLKKDVRIVISSVQGTRRIYDEFKEKGFTKKQLVTKLIL